MVVTQTIVVLEFQARIYLHGWLSFVTMSPVDRAPLVTGRNTGLATMFVGKPTRIGRFVRVTIVLAAAMVFLASFDASNANASCGDYVMVGGHGHTDSHHSMPGTPTCRGPNCHNRAPLPVLPTKGLLTAPPVDLAYWSQSGASSQPSLCGVVVERRLWLCDGYSLPLLRPPCL